MPGFVLVDVGTKSNKSNLDLQGTYKLMKERKKPVVIIQCGKLCDKVKTQGWG